MQTVSHLLRQKGNEFFWVTPADSVRKAIELMATHHVGALLVMAPGASSGAPPAPSSASFRSAITPAR